MILQQLAGLGNQPSQGSNLLTSAMLAAALSQPTLAPNNSSTNIS